MVPRQEQASQFPGRLIRTQTAGRPHPRIPKSAGLGGTREAEFLPCFQVPLMLLVWETTPSEPPNQLVKVKAPRRAFPQLSPQAPVQLTRWAAGASSSLPGTL